MQKFLSYYSAVVIFLLLNVPGPVLAKSARSLVEAGNEAFSRGDYSTSLENYEKAGDVEPDSTVILFNKGDALYKQNKYDEAMNVFGQAATQAMENGDHTLEAQSRYNMGNSAYRMAEMFGSNDLQKSVAEYKRSSDFFQSALKLNPNLTEAAYNLEAARTAAKQTEELLRRQQQQAQQRQQQRQEIAKTLKNIQKEQQAAAEQSRDLTQSNQPQAANSEAAQQQAEQQKSITEKTKAAEKKLQQSTQGQNAEQPDKKARQHVNKAVAKQEEAQKNLQENNPSEARENQQKASQELQEAVQQLKQDEGKNQGNKGTGKDLAEKKGQAGQQKQQQQEQPGAAENPGQRNGNEDASQVAKTTGSESPEDIINEELENRKYRTVQGGIGYKSVDKDW